MGYGFDYGYDSFSGFEPAFDSSIAGIGGFLLAFLGFFYLIFFGIMLLCYIFQSVSLHTIAKRRGIKHPWLCWLPIGDVWILGSISDQYQYVAKGKVKNRRHTLVGIVLGVFLIGVPLLVGSIVGMLVGLYSFSGGEMATSGVLFGVFILVYIAVLVLGIVNVVLRYIALYDVYASCNPDNATLFLVLSIFFGITIPFFLFSCRKKDFGMPPRKPLLEEEFQL